MSETLRSFPDAPGRELGTQSSRRGPAASSIPSRSISPILAATNSPGLERPDIQYYLVPIAMNRNGSESYFPSYHGYNIHWCGLRPQSRGEVTLRSANPADPPRILNNYLQAEEDKQVNRAAFRLARQLHQQKAFDSFRGDEVEPGPTCQSNSDIDGFMAEFVSSHYHPVGTCKMGVDDQAVVDPQLWVHGVNGLRVVDASVMPLLVGANTNAPTIMIAERASDLIARG
jgi:choline dehydrogenase